MNKKRTTILIWSLFSCLLFLVASLSFVTPEKKQEKVQEKVPTIALVNEDSPSKFNNQEYNFGKNFVDLVSNDNSYNWQVVSRPVADRAYIDGSVDAVIYLPQTFSKDLLTLQDIDPTQAKVNYKIQPQKDELSEKLVQNKITSILYTFNQNVVKMYYASIAGNIAEAENLMNTTVGKHENLVLDLSDRVQNPFKNSMPNYATFIAGASSLSGINKANVSMQNSFMDSAKNMMSQTGGSFASQLPQITDYFGMQNKIASTNIENANKGMLNQSESDQQFYFNQYDALHMNFMNQLNGVYTKDAEGNETGDLANLKQKVLDYNDLIEKIRANLSEQITTLTTKRDDLLGLENDLYNQFFSQDVSATTENFDSFSNLQIFSNAKTALAAKLMTSFGKQDNLTGSDYLTQLANLIGSFSLEPTDYKLEELVANGTIDNATKMKIEQELQVVQQYANAFGLSGGTVTLEDAPKTDTVNQRLTRVVKITVPAGTTYKSSAFPSEVIVTPVSPTTGITVNADNSITLDNPVPKNPDGSSGVGNPQVFEFQMDVDLGNKTTESFVTTWTNQATSTDLFQTTDTFTLVPREGTTSYNQYIEENFQSLNGWLSQIESAAKLIAIFYAKPNEDYTSLLSAVTQDDFKSRSQSSIFNMYGNMDLLEVTNRLSDQDVQEFMTMGQNDLNKVIQTVKELNTTITSLQNNESLLKNHLPEQYFADNLASLNGWYTQTVEEIENTYNKWKNQNFTALEIKDWNQYDSSKTELYQDSSNGLYEQIQTLVATNENSTRMIAESAQVVKDNSDGFEQLMNQAATTQKDAQNLLANTDDLVSKGNQEASDSKNFYNEFSKTLANTRTQGVNKQGIYNFFANPIKSSNVTPKTNRALEQLKEFDFRWILVFGIGLIFGLLMMLLGQTMMKKVQK